MEDLGYAPSESSVLLYEGPVLTRNSNTIVVVPIVEIVRREKAANMHYQRIADEILTAQACQKLPVYSPLQLTCN
jgi:hypothetical protein